MKKAPVALAIGDIRWDDAPFGPCIGGTASIFAARLAALGIVVRFAGVVGEAQQGEAVIKELAASGVDTSLVQKHPSLATERAVVEFLEDRTPVITTRARGAAENFEVTDELVAFADESEVLFWSSPTQRGDITGSNFRKFLEVCPSSFKVFDIDCAFVVPTREELEVALGVASVAHIRGRDISTVCEILGLPELEPGLLAPAITERFGVSYCVIADPLAGALISSIAGEQVGMDIVAPSEGDLLGWHEAFLAAFVYHVFQGSTLARCCEAAARYADSVAATEGALSSLADSEIALIKARG